MIPIKDGKRPTLLAIPFGWNRSGVALARRAGSKLIAHVIRLRCSPEPKDRVGPSSAALPARQWAGNRASGFLQCSFRPVRASTFSDDKFHTKAGRSKFDVQIVRIQRLGRARRILDARQACSLSHPKLGTDDESLLKGRITVAPETRRILDEPDGKGRVARIDCGCRGRNLAPYLFQPKKRCQRDAQRNGSAAQRA
jgi:hypothetical protein